VKVLLAHSDPVTRKRCAQWLASAGHVVLEADTASSACALLSKGAEVAIADWHLTGGGATFVHQLRSTATRQRHYLIVTCARPTDEEAAAIYGAGADDLAVTASMTRSELLGRVAGLERTRGLAAMLGAAAKTVEFGPLFDLNNVRAWRELGSIVSVELGEQLGSELHAVADAPHAIAVSGAVSLSLAVEQIELQLSIGIEREMIAPLGAALLDGDTSEVILADALRELANVAGGAIKRAAGNDATAMTIGLPTNACVENAPNARTWSATTSTGLRLRIAAIARPCKGRAVRRASLREGMVLAGDVRNPAGLLLVAAGTYLTSTTVDALARTLEANALVEVSEPMAVGVVRAAS
jgi:DNA-binding response OmpR family regulator